MHCVSSGGSQLSITQFEWDISSDCSTPRRVLYYAKGHNRLFHKEQWTTATVLWETFPYRAGMEVLLITRCRVCESCRRQSRRAWMRRCIVEYSYASRCWLGTLTLRPFEHWRFTNIAIAACAAKSVVFETLSLKEQLSEIHAVISREITLMFKRLRKAGYKFRYLSVLETHKSGLPHYHLMIFERGTPVPKVDLEKNWSHGFSSFRLVNDQRGACYAAKYISKTNVARVRASVGFGEIKSVLDDRKQTSVK